MSNYMVTPRKARFSGIKFTLRFNPSSDCFFMTRLLLNSNIQTIEGFPEF